MITAKQAQLLSKAHDALTAVVKQDELFKEFHLQKQFLLTALMCLEAQMRRKVKPDAEIQTGFAEKG